jgi:hypothetical protein
VMAEDEDKEKAGERRPQKPATAATSAWYWDSWVVPV